MFYILVVEDQKSVLMQVEALLKSRGYIVIMAENSHDAIEQLTRFRIDLVITDIMMPGGASGFELTKTIKKDPRYAGIPLMMMTGRRDQRDVEKGILSGADDYVVKPLDSDLFLAKVDALLQKRGKPDFTSCAISVAGQWDLNAEIVGISELGLEVNSPVAVYVGTNIKMHTDLFRRIGVPVPVMHVTACDPISENPRVYGVRLSFIGYTDKELKPIRVWIRDQSAKSAS